MAFHIILHVHHILHLPEHSGHILEQLVVALIVPGRPLFDVRHAFFLLILVCVKRLDQAIFRLPRFLALLTQLLGDHINLRDLLLVHRDFVLKGLDRRSEFLNLAIKPFPLALPGMLQHLVLGRRPFRQLPFFHGLFREPLHDPIPFVPSLFDFHLRSLSPQSLILQFFPQFLDLPLPLDKKIGVGLMHGRQVFVRRPKELYRRPRGLATLQFLFVFRRGKSLFALEAIIFAH